jgi:ABC-2 type transport system permease protein
MNAVKREILEGIRTYKFLVLAIGFVFYAFLDPIMLKVLPEIMKSQAPGIDLQALMAIDRKAASINYMKSVSQIGVIIAAFVCMKATAGELREGTFTLPFIGGLKPSQWIGAKVLVYGSALLICSVAGMLLNAFYAGSLFSEGASDYLAVLKAGLWFGLYFVMLLLVEIFTGCLTQSPAIAAVSGLGVSWLLPPLSGLLGISGYSPSYLLEDANALSAAFPAGLLPPLLITAGILVLLYFASVRTVRYADLGRRHAA